MKKIQLFILIFISFIASVAFAQNGSSAANAIPIGICGNGTFSENRSSATYGMIYYKLDLPSSANVSISLCGSDYDTYLMVLTNDSGIPVYSNDDHGPLCLGSRSSLQENFDPGSYYILVSGYEGAVGNVAITVTTKGVRILGKDMASPILAGSFDVSGSYTDTRNNSSPCFGNDIGQLSNDIYYKFVLNRAATVTLSHCGSNFDTYMHLLDGLGNLITSNDDNSLPACPGNQAYIQTNLSPGIYYMVSEGYSGNSGNIVSSIQISITESCALLSASPTEGRSYVSTFSPRVPLQNVSSLLSSRICQVEQDIQYLDGLGRPVQMVRVKGTLANDIVEPITYDNLGRNSRNFLPYVSASIDGAYRSAAASEVVSYYQSQPLGNAVAFATPFSDTRYDGSPLSKMEEQGGPGTSWQIGAGHTSRVNYRTNNSDQNYVTTGYAVRMYNADVVTTPGAEYQRALSVNGYFATDALSVSIVRDENWITTDGKAGTTEQYKDKFGRVVLNRSFNKNNSGIIEVLSTYYVYDDLGNLSFVLTPGMNPDAATIPTQTALNNLGYQYRYDHRSRVIEKKNPGKDWEYYVYNSQDQLILTQDGNSRLLGKWYFSKYDRAGRIVLSGVYINSNPRATVQSSALVVSDIYESREPNAEYGNLAFPQSATDIQIINYYDDYTFPGATSYLYGAANAAPTDQVTGMKAKVIGSNTFLLSINYYDSDNRLSKVFKQHYVSGAQDIANFDEFEYAYNFSGQVSSSIRTHHKGASKIPIVVKYEYDGLGREILSRQTINSGSEVILKKLDYNDLGQLLKKSLHSTDGSTFLQNTNYTYNERGWLKSAISGQFSERLKYDEGAKAQYNGNIAYQDWGTGTNFPNTFTYTYDKLNRLTDGSSTGTILMSEKVSYDLMGNIKTLNRNNAGAGTYNYTNGNQLLNITGGGLAGGSYVYDGNGNATTDGRTGMVLSYNILDLPATATKSGLSLSYVYDALGNRLKKISNGVTRDYIDGIEYSGGSIELIQTAEGIARNNGGTYTYEYNLRDHLGNVRYGFKKNTGSWTIDELQKVNYLPFGKANFENAGTNKYLYNGKELQSELSSSGQDGQYDYGARFYDPVIGRFSGVDAMAEESADVSPYAYVSNSPINFIDPTGMIKEDWYKSNLTGTIKWFEGSGPQEGYKRLFDQGQVISSGSRSGAVNLNANGSATNARTGEDATSSVSGKTIIVAKDNGDYATLNAVNDFITAGSVTRMKEAMDTYDREGFQSYIYHMIGNAHTEELLLYSSGAREFGASPARSVGVKAEKIALNGSFSISNWGGYPAGGIKPSGPFRLLQGMEYSTARDLANKTNQAIRNEYSAAFKGFEIHEIHPVKFGGSPTSLSNKVFLTRKQHMGYTNYWNKIMRELNQN